MTSTPIDRLAFLKAGFAAGGLVATSSLPGFAADNLDVFAKRGEYERLSLVYRHLQIGIREPFSLLHISDTHLTEADPSEGEKWAQWRDYRRSVFGGLQHAALESSLVWAKKHVDLVLHTGDLIDYQSKANLSCVRKCFGVSGNILALTGNHDYQREPEERGIEKTAVYNRVSREALDSVYGFDTLFSSSVVRNVNFVRLDNSYGTVTAEQAAKFEAEVEKGLPIVLAMHVPIYTDAIWRAREKFWRMEAPWHFRSGQVPVAHGDYARQKADADTQDFLRYLKSEKLLKAVLAGHLHFDIEDRISPTAMEYVVGGNFLFHGAEILIS